jgi:hypothetical protein
VGMLRAGSWLREPIATSATEDSKWPDDRRLQSDRDGQPEGLGVLVQEDRHLE